MKRISWSPLSCKIFDVISVGFMTLWTAGAAVASITQRSLLAVLFMAVGTLFCALGYWTVKRDWKLADEVSDAGDVLVVRKGSIEARIAFSEIQAVDESNFVRPPRVLLELRQSHELGPQISFIPRSTFASAFGHGRSIADSIRERLPHLT
jgi:hypothetical protein